MGWGRTVVAAGRVVEARFDQMKFELKRWAGWLGPIEVLPYRGHGTTGTLFMKGRVLERKGITRSSTNDTVGTNLRTMLLRFASDEIPFARVRARFDGYELETVADGEGFFDLRFELATPPDATIHGTRSRSSSCGPRKLECEPPGVCSSPLARGSA